MQPVSPMPPGTESNSLIANPSSVRIRSGRMILGNRSWNLFILANAIKSDGLPWSR